MPTHRAPLFVIAALLLALPLAGCGEDKTSKAAAAPPPPPQVTVSKPTKRVISEHDEYVGRFVAVDYVEVRSRVSGYLQTIDFTDGQIVKKGEPSLHHRSAAIPSCSRSDEGRRGAGEG